MNTAYVVINDHYTATVQGVADLKEYWEREPEQFDPNVLEVTRYFDDPAINDELKKLINTIYKEVHCISMMPILRKLGEWKGNLELAARLTPPDSDKFAQKGWIAIRGRIKIRESHLRSARMYRAALDRHLKNEDLNPKARAIVMESLNGECDESK